MNVRGDSGGLEEALFWCFARMGKCTCVDHMNMSN